MINDLARLIEINTTSAPASEGAPFGIGNRKALDVFCDMAKNYGLAVGNDDGYAAWAEYGDGQRLIGILGHLDVVPAGAGWSTDPFRLTVENGMLIGRGVSDDKGPVVACLHALARLKKENVKLNGRVRLIVGSNEEEGSACVKHYVKHCEVPVVAFTPDSDFPVTASEKGILHLEISLPLSDLAANSYFSVEGGEKANIVPNFCKVVIKNNSAIYKKLSAWAVPADILKTEKVALALATHGCDLADFSIYPSGENIEMTARGIAAHASTPLKGDNAVTKMLVLLAALSDDDALNLAAEIFGTRRPEEKLGIACRDESSEMTVNVGVCRKHGDKLVLTLDFRIPACMNAEEVIKAVKAVFGFNAEYKTLHSSPVLSVDENGLLVRTLMQVYRECTGDNESKPLHIGGGTYAKELPCCVAFGAVFPGRDTHMHDADECYPVEDFYKLEEIYYKAILALDKAFSVAER